MNESLQPSYLQQESNEEISLDTTEKVPEMKREKSARKEITDDRNVRDLQHYLEFDRILKERVHVKPGEGTLEAYRMHKTYLKPIKAFVIVVYYCFIPFL